MSKKFYANTSDSALIAQVGVTDVEMPTELSERQKRLLKYRMRGLTQKAIAQIENVSQPFISQELNKIKKIFAEQGKQIDQHAVVGESLNIFQEVEHRAWDLYYKSVEGKSHSDANKALSTVLTARDRGIKLLMDLGLIKRAAIEHKHSVAPFLEKWQQQSQEDKRIVVESVIETQLSDLEEPQPPALPDYLEYEDVEEDESS